jgi:hypothetical protein
MTRKYNITKYIMGVLEIWNENTKEDEQEIWQ